MPPRCRKDASGHCEAAGHPCRDVVAAEVGNGAQKKLHSIST